MEASPREILNHMLSGDAFSTWLGITIESVVAGSCTLKMTVRQEMTNGFGIAHGGITYSLADTALAFASNSHGIHAVSIETGISHTAKVQVGDCLTAIAKEEVLTSKTGIYSVRITNQHENLVALFKGTVYKTGKQWEIH